MMAAVVSSVIIHIRVGIFLSVLVHKKTLLILIDIPCADVLFFPGFFVFFSVKKIMKHSKAFWKKEVRH